MQFSLPLSLLLSGYVVAQSSSRGSGFGDFFSQLFSAASIQPLSTGALLNSPQVPNVPISSVILSTPVPSSFSSALISESTSPVVFASLPTADAAYSSAADVIKSIANAGAGQRNGETAMSMVTASQPTPAGVFNSVGSKLGGFFTNTVASEASLGASKVASGFSAATSGVLSGFDKAGSKVTSAFGSAATKVTHSNNASYTSLNAVSALFGVIAFAIFLL